MRWGGGRAGERASKQASERSGSGRGTFFLFFFGVGPPANRNMVRQFDARRFVALTQHIAVRGYVTLTSGARLTDRGARGVFIFFDLILFFGLVPNCPRLAGRLCLSLAIDLE